MIKLDDTDVKILRILQTDVRIPLTQLSEQLGVPHGTVRDRIRKMEEAGVIECYATVLNPVKLGFLMNCLVQVTLDQQVENSQVIDALLKIDEVTEIQLLTGDVDTLVRIWARDVEHLRQILYEKFTSIPGIVRTNTIIVLGTHVKPLPLPAPDKDPA
ncbi:MAG: Lrp/AsnC family transcriptional regulator [Chloroflexi bacterium]|nr:Lrp/AsnC family transcriptional regulator [Chloroflexota bacterium]